MNKKKILSTSWITGTPPQILVFRWIYQLLLPHIKNQWVFSDNVQHKSQWSDKYESLQLNPKLELHGRNIMLCVWWDHCCNSFWVFKLQSDTQCRHTLNSCNVCMKIVQENTLHLSIGEKLCFSMIMHSHIQQE